MKKFFIVFIFILILIFIYINSLTVSIGKEEIEENSNTNNSQNSNCTGIVNTKSLKIRSGLSLENNVIGLLSENDTVHIYSKENDWYIIKTENNLVGCVFSDYITITESNNNVIETSINASNSQDINSVLLSQDEQIFLNLINNKRIENNLPEFEIDEKILNLARLKAEDIEKNKYFSHTSPTYGNLQDMLKNNDIQCNDSSENIARFTNADTAIQKLMSSESHKNNILNQNFNYTGIGVVNSANYGKIFVQIFISK